MPKLADTDRVLQLLSDNEGLSNLRIKTELNLGDERYAIVRNELIEAGLIEKTRGRGGGIRLTRKGERESPSYDGLISGLMPKRTSTNHLLASLRRKLKKMGYRPSSAPHIR